MRAIEQGAVDLVINIPREYDEQGAPTATSSAARAVDAGVPLLTDLQLARKVVRAHRPAHPRRF